MNSFENENLFYNNIMYQEVNFDTLKNFTKYFVNQNVDQIIKKFNMRQLKNKKKK